ncbi:MAG TPA: hypothetical protein VFC17_09645, partial [Candidatus Limnocylindrales bacterium]|nr:hypothetical protein [Candidatus Limnocylindrales bacterium]
MGLKTHTESSLWPSPDEVKTGGAGWLIPEAVIGVRAGAATSSLLVSAQNPEAQMVVSDIDQKMRAKKDRKNIINGKTNFSIIVTKGQKSARQNPTSPNRFESQCE